MDAQSMEKPLVSVVIPHWNHRDVLDECLGSLRECQYDSLEIIVVDNASEDDSVPFVRENYPEVHLIQNRENRGFAGGCNVGIEAARGKYIVILNNDTTHKPDWLSVLIDYMEDHPEVGIAQPKLRNAKDRDYFDYSGAAGGYMDIYGFPFARGRIYDQIEQDEGQYENPAEIFWASGTACLLRRKVFEDVGGLDEVFFAHMEEIDLDWRAQLAGWHLAAVPSSVIYHHSGYTLPPDSPFKKYLNHRNSVIMLLSNYQSLRMMTRGFQRLLLDILALFFTLATGDFSRSWAIMKAWGWVLTHLSVIRRKRRQVKRVRRISDGELEYRFYQASIALEHYLLRKSHWDARRHSISAD